MEHKCIGYSGGIFWKQDSVVKPAGWYMNGYVPPINYCPYCGEKLEPLDMKIEVSRHTLKFWARMARGIYHYVANGPHVAARCDADGLASAIESVLTDD